MNTVMEGRKLNFTPIQFISTKLKEVTTEPGTAITAPNPRVDSHLCKERGVEGACEGGAKGGGERVEDSLGLCSVCFRVCRRALVCENMFAHFAHGSVLRHGSIRHCTGRTR